MTTNSLKALLPASLIGMCLISIWPCSSARAQPTEALKELLGALGERQGFFTSGVIEVRQSDWSLSAETRNKIAPLADLLTRTPVGAERALSTALRIEEEAVAELGAPKQTT